MAAHRTLRPLALVGALALVAAACGSDPVGPTGDSARRIDLTPQRVILRPGDQAVFEARLLDPTGSRLHGHEYQWTQADEDITVLTSSGGVATARFRRVGEDTIYVSAGGVRALAVVTAIDCLGDSRREGSCS